MTTIMDYSDLVAWQKAMVLVEAVYRATADLPLEERFGLSTQMRKAAVSIPSNIAEGQGRRTDGEFLNQLSVAHGSVRELETQILLTERLRMMDKSSTDPLMTQCKEVGKLVNGLIRSIVAEHARARAEVGRRHRRL